jgi:hypothetical protein
LRPNLMMPKLIMNSGEPFGKKENMIEMDDAL